MPATPDALASDTHARAVRRVRRHDPIRRDRILDAALHSIAEVGVAGSTHRAVAAAADVPLGSLTYHFASIQDLLAAAFARFVDEQNESYAARFVAVRSRDQLLDVLVDLVVDVPERSRSGTIGFELHLAALRSPDLRDLTESWTTHSRAELERFLPDADAARMDALLEGLILHALLATRPPERAEVVEQVGGALPARLRDGRGAIA